MVDGSTYVVGESSETNADESLSMIDESSNPSVLGSLSGPLSASSPVTRRAADLLAEYRKSSSTAGAVARPTEAEATMFAGFLEEASRLASEVSSAMAVTMNDAGDVHSALYGR